MTKLSQPFFACLLATLACASVTQAQSTSWIGGTGSWFSAGNWSAGVPNPDRTPQINNGGTAQIAGDFAHANAVFLGSFAGDSGTLAVFSIGGVRGDLAVDGGLGLLSVGGGSSTLRISGDASVTNKFGGISGSSGSSVTVSGPGARWDNLNSLSVGGGGTSGRGTLLIEGGGKVFSPDSGLGSLAGSSAMVTGAGSNWLTTGNLEIGNYHGTGGFGTLTVADSGSVRVDGQLTISALSRVVLGAGGTPGTLQVSSIRNDGLLHFNHSGATTLSALLSGAGRVHKDGAGSTTITNAATLAGPFTVNTGLLVLRNVIGANTFSANNGGTLRFDAATVNLTSTGAIRANFGGSIEYSNSTVNSGFLRGPGTHMLLAGGTNTFNGVTTFNSTAIVHQGTAYFINFTNGGTLTANGTLNLDGAVNAASGAITVNGALLANDFTNNGILNINNGATLDNGASNLVSGGGSRATIGAGGTVFLSDDTSWELNGALVVNNGEVYGTTNVNFGSVAKGAGAYDVVNVNQGGVYAPGNSAGVSTAASVHFDNSPTIVAGPTLIIELAGIVPGTGYDQLHVTGPLSLGGTMAVSLIEDFTPAAGNAFDILDWATLSGTFSTITLPALAGLAWDTSQLYTTGVLSVIGPSGLAGDYNQNGTVDAADYIVWRNGLGTTYTQNDYTIWRTNFGRTSGSGATAGLADNANAAVPEPAAWAMLLGALCLLELRTVRRRRPCGAVACQLLPRHASRALLFAVFAITSPQLSGSASAQDAVWSGGTGTWGSLANWQSGLLPNLSRNASIDNGGTAQIGSFFAYGEASRLTLGSNMGESGNVRIFAGGTLTSTTGFIGQASSSTGTATIDGAGSTWTTSGGFVVGNFGAGFLNISAGGSVSNNNSDIGQQEGSTGTATVDGAGSAWKNNSRLAVGTFGDGSLAITGGGAVSSTNGLIGHAPGANGTVSVDGTESNWKDSGDLTVGQFGAGTLSISAGGQVSNYNSQIGQHPDSVGTATVNGAGSRWTNNSVVAVGILGKGTLSITDGGVVSSTNGRIAREAGSSGIVLIDGPGSRWNASGVVTMGLSGAGTAALEIRNGGVLSATTGMTIGPLGTVRGNGTIQANVSNTSGVIAPNSPGNSPGTLHITGNYQQSVGGRLQIELASAASFDKLDVTGEITLDNTLFGPPLGGTLDVSLIDDFVPHGTQSFDILDWSGSLSGAFSAIILPTLGGILAWDTSQLYTTGVLSVIGPANLAGDYNDDGIVDAADYVVWRNESGTPAGYEAWRANFGQSAGSGGALPSAQPLSVAVPEPWSWVLFCLGLIAFVGQDRKNGPGGRQKVIAVPDIVAYAASAVWPRGWLAPPAPLQLSEPSVRQRSYLPSVGSLDKEQPSTLGGSLKRKPTCRNASGCSSTSAFFVFSGARG